MSMPFRIDPATLDFALPEELIAQEPAPIRDHARLLVLHRATGALEHKRFSDIASYLKAGDVLVINKAKVSRVKLMGQKTTGGKVDVLFLENMNGGSTWKALVRPLLKQGTAFRLEGDVELIVKDQLPSGEFVLGVQNGDVRSALTQQGRLPLPPYIKRSSDDPRTKQDEREYQTVFAKEEGSVAAPTAGLHFTDALLDQIKTMGVQVVEILLHVGWGTFRPIAGTVAEHKMMSERYEVSPEAMTTLREAKRAGRRVIAVGTTSTRTLESMDAKPSGETALFIKPGFQFKWVDALVTNLHVPKSTPVSLTAAFAGLENLERAYAAAIAEKYRFFSYGDAMLIL